MIYSWEEHGTIFTFWKKLNLSWIYLHILIPCRIEMYDLFISIFFFNLFLSFLYFAFCEMLCKPDLWNKDYLLIYIYVYIYIYIFNMLWMIDNDNNLIFYLVFRIISIENLCVCQEDW